jgi:hypothetical protein
MRDDAIKRIDLRDGGGITVTLDLSKLDLTGPEATVSIAAEDLSPIRTGGLIRVVDTNLPDHLKEKLLKYSSGKPVDVTLTDVANTGAHILIREKNVGVKAITQVARAFISCGFMNQAETMNWLSEGCAHQVLDSDRQALRSAMKLVEETR